jgi:peptide/nickel transport system substrate-binding protein
LKNLRWQILIVVLALAAIGVLLLVQQQPNVAEPPAPVQPVTGGIYTEAIIGSFGRLNPVLDFYNPADRDASRLLYSGLVRFDDRGLPVGDLAETWAMSKDGTSYSFSIRSNAVWQDGEPVTSDDVVFTVDYLRSDDLPIPDDLRQLWKQVDVNVLDEKTVQFHLPEPFAPFLDYLSFGLLPRHILQKTTPSSLVDAEFNLKPVGSGPYRFDHLISEAGQIKGIVFSAFDDYYNGRPYIDQIVFLYYPDAASALAAYQGGTVLGISRVSGDILSKALNTPELNLYTGRLPELTLIYFNLDEADLPFLQDATLRRALLTGLNRQRMVDQTLGGQAILADGPVFPGSWAYYEGIEHLPYDSDAALETIKKAGYTIPAEGGEVREKEGVKFSFEIVYPDDALHKALFQQIQSDWARLGVQVKPKPVTYDSLLADYLEPRTYQAALVDLNLSRYPDPDPYPFWDQAQATGGQNYAKWNDRRSSEFLEQARVSLDLDERTKAYRNFQVRFTTEMPALPLFYPVFSYAVDAQVQGVRMGPLYDPSDRLATIAKWYLIARRPSGAAPTGTPTP